METCKTCKFFGHKEKHEEKDFIIGLCDLEPFDIEDMESNQMAVQCGHDGKISVGENFGCINHKIL